MEQMSLINNIVNWEHRSAMAEERSNNLKGLPYAESAMSGESRKNDHRPSTKQNINRRKASTTANC